ncbi:MAG: response regulator [Treponema sp.]|jgi:putative two-component system response regulator|nr:response regulator [Treponema sp.]
MEERKNTLLIVDDEKSNLEVLINILGPEYTIFMTKSSAAAFEMAQKHMPDVILLDIMMPEMDGFEVLAGLKKSEKTRNIPVIFTTGLNSVQDEEKMMDAGAVDFVHKPFSAKVVKMRVRNQIQIVNLSHIAEKAANMNK